MEKNNANDMHDSITSAEDDVLQANKHVEENQHETPKIEENIAENNNHSNDNNEKSSESETEKRDLPLEPVFHIINIDDTDDLPETTDTQTSVEHIEVIIEQVNGDMAATEKDPLTNTDTKKIKYVARPKRSLSMRDHLRRNKEEVPTIAAGLSASAPHLTGLTESSVAAAIHTMLRHMLQPMENKMNMKVFGSKRAMKDERVRYNKAGFVIHPMSSFR